MSFTEKVRFIINLSIEKKIWLVLFTLGSLLAFFALKFMSMRKLSMLMGHHLDNHSVCIPTNRQKLLKALEMGQLMSMIANNTPWPCKCLSQALCVKWLLNRYEIPSILHLGAKINSEENRSIQAHAWINVHSFTVIGAPQHKQYKPVATFTTPSLI